MEKCIKSDYVEFCVTIPFDVFLKLKKVGINANDTEFLETLIYRCPDKSKKKIKK